MTGLIAVGVLVALIIVLAVLAFRPGGGVYLNERQANIIRQAHEDAKRRPPGVQMIQFDAPDSPEKRRRK